MVIYIPSKSVFLERCDMSLGYETLNFLKEVPQSYVFSTTHQFLYYCVYSCSTRVSNSFSSSLQKLK